MQILTHAEFCVKTLYISLVFHLLKNLVCGWHLKRHKKESRCFWEVQSSSNFLSVCLRSTREQTLQREETDHTTTNYTMLLFTTIYSSIFLPLTHQHTHNLSHAPSKWEHDDYSWSNTGSQHVWSLQSIWHLEACGSEFSFLHSSDKPHSFWSKRKLKVNWEQTPEIITAGSTTAQPQINPTKDQRPFQTPHDIKVWVCGF